MFHGTKQAMVGTAGYGNGATESMKNVVACIGLGWFVYLAVPTK
jgi:hypothetical protein